MNFSPYLLFRFGKSTLLNLIDGLDRPTSGSIVANGQDIAALSPLDLALCRLNTIGMVFQSFNLLYAHDAGGKYRATTLGCGG